MDGGGDEEGEGFGDAVISIEDRDVFQAVDHQEGEDGGGEGLAQVFHIARQLASRLEAQEGEEAGDHGAQGADADDGGFLPEGKMCHKRPPAFSIGFLKRVMIASMPAMAGITKESFPKVTSERRETAMPMRAV